MEELKRTKRITIASIIALIVLVIAIFSYKKPLNYMLSAKDMTYELMMVAPVTPTEAKEYMRDSTKIFVDIRNPFEYQADHLENAINIPVADLLEPANLDRFNQWKKDSVQVILYGNSEREATSPWMVLYQLGYTNTQLMLGGMDYIDKHYSDQLAEEESFNVEAPLYHYASIIETAKNADSDQPAAEPQQKVILRKKNKKAAEGGC